MELRTPDAGGWPWEYLLLLVWGHSGNFPDVANRAAPWANASPVLVPRADVVGMEPGSALLTKMERQRDKLRPEDMLAAPSTGWPAATSEARSPGEDLKSLAANLRRLADAFEAFNNYSPGAFLDTETLREIANRAEPAAGEDGP